MCNDYRSHVPLSAIERGFSDLRMPLLFPEGRPNLEPRDDIRITDPGPIVRAAGGRGQAELVQRRWSWPGPGGKPVYNFRSEGRTFGNSETGGRCLIVADGFYEFTDPPGDAPRRGRKHKWLFTPAPEGPLAAGETGASWFAIAGLWRRDPDVGEAFTMLTVAPGPDVAPYHGRQVAILAPDQWAAWLDQAEPARDRLRPSPAGSLLVERVA